jgi:hypothetical protein
MEAPSISMASPCSIRIDWAAPNDGGSPITGYNLSLVRKGTVLDISKDCNLNSRSRRCILTMSDLMQDPYSYKIEDSIEALIYAENENGDGIVSPLSESGIILTQRPPQLDIPTYTTSEGG